MPAGPARRPLISTSVRSAPRPRSDTVCTSLPPFATKRFEIAELIWIDPCAPGVDWSKAASWTCPCNLAVSGSMIWTGSGLVDSLLAMRDPVTIYASPDWANDGDAARTVREAVGADKHIRRVDI